MQCYFNHRVVNGKCVKCSDKNCGYCPDNINKCIACQDDEGNSSGGLTPQGTCAPCPKNCDDCFYASRCLNVSLFHYTLPTK